MSQSRAGAPRATSRRGPGSGSDAPGRYRPEIDGLRAVAVLAVIVNHVSARLLPGGYLGVDVFFVISGFVITASLAHRPATGLADLMLGFYARRIRRLLPALLLCVLITAVALCLVNPEPGQMLGVGWRSLFGFSNLILHRLAVDYFSPAAELNPFTHTWTLGVEEQFYLLLPLLVWFSGFARRGRSGYRRLFWLLMPLAVASFGVFLQQLGVDEPAAYFLLPARFWELGVGCLLWLALPRRNPAAATADGEPAPVVSSPGRAAAPIRLPLALAALVGLLGVMALPLPFGALPVGAAVALSALLLATLRPGGAARGLLSSPPLVFLGLISYSLYLWHWSVLTLARWTVGLTALTIPLLLALTLVLAVLSWRFVEEPLRRSPWWPERWQVLATGLLLAALGTGALQLLTRYGAARLFLGDVNAAFALPAADGTAPPAPPRDCSGPGHGRLLVAGDSHALVFQAAADQLCRRHGLGYAAAATVGMPYPPLLYTNPASGMNLEHAVIFAQVEEERWSTAVADRLAQAIPRDLLVLALRWPLYFDPGRLGRMRHFDASSGEPISRRQALERWIAGVDQIAAAHPRTPIVLLLPTPEFVGGVPMLLCQPQWFRPRLPEACGRGIDRREPQQLTAYLRQKLAPLLARHPNLRLHDPLDTLCPPGQGRCPRLRQNRLLYSDGDHLSAYGASLVIDDLLTAQRRPSPHP